MPDVNTLFAASAKNIFDLNNDVILNVLERLDVLSVIAFQTVCRPHKAYDEAIQIYYRQMCQNFVFSFDGLRKRKFSNSQTELLFERIGKYIVRLTIRGYFLNCDMRLMNELMAAHCVNLKHLHLRGHRLFDSRPVSETMQVTGLTSLKLELLSVNNDHIRQYIECNQDTMETIDFCDVTNFPGLLIDIVEPPLLKRLSVSCSDMLRPDQLIGYLRSQPNLIEFELNLGMHMGGTGFGDICSNMLNLQSLTLSASNLKGEITNIARLKRLTKLRLQTYDNINALLVELVAHNQLQELCLDGSFGQIQLDTATLRGLAGLTNLRVISLIGCDFVNAAFLDEMGVMCGLKEMHLVLCDNVTATSLAGYLIKVESMELLTMKACRLTQKKSELRIINWLAIDLPGLKVVYL